MVSEVPAKIQKVLGEGKGVSGEGCQKDLGKKFGSWFLVFDLTLAI
jgi:hypothetical protein